MTNIFGKMVSMMKGKEIKGGLISGFIQTLAEYPNRIALEVDDELYTYKQLGQMVLCISSAINQYEMQTVKMAAFLAYRSPVAYAAPLGILASGKGYVPLNPEFPTERSQTMLSLSGANVLVVGKECVDELKALLPLLDKDLTILFPDTETIDEIIDAYPNHHYIFSNDLIEKDGTLALPDVDPDDAAYLLFTSGSTGVPKGVPVSHRNVCSYVEYICDRYNIRENDRLSQTFDMTFDLSVHDMFVAWQRGACLCCVPKKFVMAPAKFIKEKQLTVWFSVPSVAMFMSRLHMLSEKAFPSLRLSLFCGEPLSGTLAEEWQKAAPKSTVENLYGPTEATIAISYYTWDSKASPDACVNGVVPIGFIFDTQECCVIDNKFDVVDAGEPGELCLSGTQVTNGYLNNPEKTKSQFINIPSQGDKKWYRTGDLVRQGDDGCLYYLGRIDNQVQILGHRVELQEVDNALRKASDTEMAISVAWPIKDGTAGGVVGFIAGKNGFDQKAILDQCKDLLPDYMVPKKIHFVEAIPLNNNGKLDRKKLTEMLEEGVLV